MERAKKQNEPETNILLKAASIILQTIALLSVIVLPAYAASATLLYVYHDYFQGTSNITKTDFFFGALGIVAVMGVGLLFVLIWMSEPRMTQLEDELSELELLPNDD